MKYIDVQYLKRKFAIMLSMAYTDCNIDLDNINERLLRHPFLDCFEKNDLWEIEQLSSDALVKNIFEKNILEHRDICAELFWAGLQYFNIALNLNIPFKQVIILFPLNEIVDEFPVFHEMSDEKLLEKYILENSNRSIIRELRKRKGYSVRQLGVLTGINEQTIKYYEKDNNNLFNASFTNVELISNALGYSKDIYKKNSSFVPYVRSAFSVDRFRSYFENLVGELEKRKNVKLILDEPVMGYTFTSNGKEKKEYMNDEETSLITLKAFRNTLVYQVHQDSKLVI